MRARAEGVSTLTRGSELIVRCAEEFRAAMADHVAAIAEGLADGPRAVVLRSSPSGARSVLRVIRPSGAARAAPEGGGARGRLLPLESAPASGGSATWWPSVWRRGG